MADSLDTRVAILEQIARDIGATLDRIESRMDRIEARIDRLEDRMDRQFRWLMGVMLGGFVSMLAGFAGMLGVMAHGFHWL